MTVRIAAIALAVKFGPKVLSLGGKLLKSAKVAKLGLAGASAASYAWLWSWEFALVVLVSLVIHEYGHVRAMKLVGIPTKGFYLIPFFGGAAVPERAFQNRMEEQFVAIAGPIFGLAQAVLFYAVYVYSGHPLAAAIAAWVSILNLINLIPISPLDGGRIMKSVAFSIGSVLGSVFLIGAISACAAAMIYLKSWALAVITVIALAELLYLKRSHAFTFMPAMSPLQMVSSLGLYFLTAAGFILVIAACASVPEAQLALELLRD